MHGGHLDIGGPPTVAAQHTLADFGQNQIGIVLAFSGLRF